MEETEESYTSQDCPFCGGRHHANGRNFICSVHQTEIHRDVNGAQNIARKKHHDGRQTAFIGCLQAACLV